MLEKGRPAIVRRALGSKLEKMVFGKSGETGRSTKVVEVPEAERNAFSLKDDEVLELARLACAIEKHYGRPMDIEWGKDGDEGSIHVLQARPETVRSTRRPGGEERYRLKAQGKVLVSGRAIGHRIGAGAVRIVADASKMYSGTRGEVRDPSMPAPNS